MQPHETITAAIHASAEAGRPALIPFITAGYPEPQTFIGTLADIARIGDVVEIGIPFSDPMADGMTIQRSSFAAIENGVTLRWVFDQLSEGPPVDAPLVMMSYLNPLLAFGYESLAHHAAKNGVGAFIVPDLPLEESDELRAALDASGVGLVQMVTPVTPPERAQVLAQATRGFLYAVTITGITGSDAGLPAEVTDYLDRLSAVSPLPVCAGFGIRRADDVAAVGRHAAGAIVGSALVELLEEGAAPGDFLRGLRP